MTTLRALAFVDGGQWKARCPRPFCTNAEHFGPDPVTRHVGGLTGATFRCAHCGWLGPADWPPNVDDIMYLLNQRPVPLTRNWAPGEDLHDLLQENVAHGIVPGLPDALEAGESGRLIAIEGDHISGGLALPNGVSRNAIGVR